MLEFQIKYGFRSIFQYEFTHIVFWKTVVQPYVITTHFLFRHVYAYILHVLSCMKSSSEHGKTALSFITFHCTYIFDYHHKFQVQLSVKPLCIYFDKNS